MTQSIDLEMATVQDILEELARRYGGVSIILLDVKVQGPIQGPHSCSESIQYLGRAATQTPLMTQIGMLESAKQSLGKVLSQMPQQGG